MGKDFDALRVNVAAPGGPIDLIQKEGPKVGSGHLANTKPHATVTSVFFLISGSFGKVFEPG